MHQTLEFIWRGSDSLGKETQIFAHILGEENTCHQLSLPFLLSSLSFLDLSQPFLAFHPPSTDSKRRAVCPNRLAL